MRSQECAELIKPGASRMAAVQRSWGLSDVFRLCWESKHNVIACVCADPPAHQNGGAQGSCTQTAAMCMTSVRCCMPACSSPGQVAVYSKQHSARLPLTCACGMNHPRAAFQSIQRHSVGFCCSHSRDSTLLAHAGAVYNVVDDNPASRLEVMAHARQLLTGQLSPQSLASPQSGSDR